MTSDSNLSFSGNRLSLQAARVFLVFALGGAGYLAFVSLSGGGVAGCGPGSGCNEVLSSHWAYWMGIPVSLPAIAVYLSLLIATWTNPGRTFANKPAARFVMIALAATILLAAAWFGFVQYAIIKHWCKFCLATHASALAAAGCLTHAIFNRQAAPASAQETPLRLPNLAGAGAAAVFGLAILIIGQLAVKKPLFLVTRMPTKASGADAGTLRLFNNQFNLDPDALPLIGSPSATNYIIDLFDYTCSHCRRLHPLLRELARVYSGKLAIISLPVPLEAGCNPLIRNTAQANLNACEYARLGLAVFRTRPAAFQEFDDWLFDSNSIPPIEQARAKAGELAGKEPLAAALAGSWVKDQLKTDVDLYMIDSQVMRNAHLPQLLFGDAAIAGSIETMDELLRVFNQRELLRRSTAPTNAPGRSEGAH